MENYCCGNQENSKYESKFRISLVFSPNSNSWSYMPRAACGIHYKYVGRCPVQGVFCFTWSSEKETAPSMFWLLEPWRHLLEWTNGLTLWSKSSSLEFSSPFLCRCSLWSWSFTFPISFIWTHLGCRQINLGECLAPAYSSFLHSFLFFFSPTWPASLLVH